MKTIKITQEQSQKEMIFLGNFNNEIIENENCGFHKWNNVYLADDILAVVYWDEFYSIFFEDEIDEENNYEDYLNDYMEEFWNNPIEIFYYNVSNEQIEELKTLSKGNKEFDFKKLERIDLKFEEKNAIEKISLPVKNNHGRYNKFKTLSEFFGDGKNNFKQTPTY